MNVWAQWPHTLKFQPVRGRYHPVRGGRWRVRRAPYQNIPRRWKAWTQGSASTWNRMFATFEEAVAWADFVTMMYATYGDKQVADQLIRERARRRHAK